ncbi:MAG: CoA transferase [Phycisphaerae bacterium]|nr:CoA transferase [Phycisphaerae bacterium]
MNRPLEGVRVLDTSRLLPAPFTTMILGDLGADVIRVESPSGGDRLRLMPPYVNGQSAYFTTINRNKRSVAIDLKSEEGLAVFLELVKTADVVVEGFKPGTMDRLGAGYEDLKAVKADIVYCSLSGYGQTGPLRERPGHDINYMGIGAALDLMTDPDARPRIPGLFLGDLSGAFYAAIGVISALVHRERTGQGAHVDGCMLDGLMGLHTFLSARHLIAGLPAEHGTTQMTDAGGCYQVYETKDGRYVTFAPLEPRFWQTFCEVVDRPGWLARQWDPSLVPELEELFKQRTREEWVTLSGEHDFCCEPVLSLQGALQHPQVIARGMVVEADDPVAGRVRHVAPAVRINGTRGDIRLPAPQLGEHTIEVLLAVGVDQERIDRLLADGVLAVQEPPAK